MTQEKVTPQTSGNYYKLVTQSVLLHVSEIWVVMLRMIEALEWMHQGVARGISARWAAFERTAGTWSHSLTAEVLQASGLLPLGEFPEKRQGKVTDSTRPVLGMCLEAVWREGVQESQLWRR